MEGRLSAALKSGVDMMTPERVFAGIGFVTIGAFLVDRCLSISANASHAHELESADFELMKKRMEHIQELIVSVKQLKDGDSLGAALEEVNNAIREYHKSTAKREAAELSVNKKKYAELLYQRAEIYYLMGKYKRAEGDLTKALLQDTTLIAANNLLLHLYVDCDELRNLKSAQQYLFRSSDHNSEQTFTKYYQAVLASQIPDMEELNGFAKQLIADLKDNKCSTRSTIPTVAVPLLMSRCMQLNVAQAKSVLVLSTEIEKIADLLKINGLVVNQQLRLIITESILCARLRMSQMMDEGSVLTKADARELLQLTYQTNISKDRVGYLYNVMILPNYVVEHLLRPQICEQYLLKPAHRNELRAVMLGFESIGKFDDEEHAVLKQQCEALQSANQDEIDEILKSFVNYIKKQGQDVWSVAVSDAADQSIHSLLRIACAEAGKDLQIFFHQDEDSLTCMREYRHQPDEEERNAGDVISVVMNTQHNKLHIMLPLSTPVAQQQFLVLKECERELALHPENKAFHRLLAQLGFNVATRKAANSQTSGSIFHRYAYPLIVLGGMAVAAIGAAAIMRKQ